MKIVPYFEKAVKLFAKHGVPKSKVFIYLLVQKDLESAERRVRALFELCPSFSIYAQAERNSLKGITPNKEQLEFAQRYVYGRSYKTMAWNEYKNRRMKR